MLIQPEALYTTLFVDQLCILLFVFNPNYFIRFNKIVLVVHLLVHLLVTVDPNNTAQYIFTPQWPTKTVKLFSKSVSLPSDTVQGQHTFHVSHTRPFRIPPYSCSHTSASTVSDEDVYSYIYLI